MYLHDVFSTPWIKGPNSILMPVARAFWLLHSL